MQGNSRKVIETEIERSLSTLQTDYIDLLYLHVDDFNTPLEETMEALSSVIKKGYVKHIGCSNFRTFRIEQAREICQQNGFPFFSAIQQRNSYFKPVADADFGIQVSADKELETYLSYYHNLTFFSHTSLLYGAYLKNHIEDTQYNTAANLERLSLLKQQPDRITYVLREMSKDFGGSVVLFTTGNIEHLKQNMMNF